MKPRRIIIEKWGSHGYGILFPSGRVVERPTKESAEQTAKRYLAHGIKSGQMRVDLIEWRDLSGQEEGSQFIGMKDSQCLD